MEARLFGTARFVVAFFGTAHLVTGPFWNRPFWCEFHENNFLLQYDKDNSN